MEERIMDEYRYRFGEKSIETCARTFFDLLTGSVINKVLINERFEKDDPDFDRLKTNLSKGLENTGFLDIFCPVEILQSKWLKWRQGPIFEPFDWILELTKRNIRKRVEQIESGQHILHDEPDDFLDAYLLRKQKEEREGVETTFT
uniref:Cytochrome P450 n=1 Tax=Caenorhabditis tropicalis TaxID=1561998 RepID=A0A1I7UE41_9PELO